MLDNCGSLIVDIDGTLCPIKKSDETYEDVKPYPHVVKRLNEWRDNGYRIVLQTSRNMRTYEGNLGLINVHTARMTMEWLDKWEIPYDEIHFGKPWPGHRGFYIDDRSIRPDEFLRFSENELEELILKGRASLGECSGVE